MGAKLPLARPICENYIAIGAGPQSVNTSFSVVRSRHKKK
jgi:hypothetical protein